MNAAIARFFDKSDPSGDMRRGVAPGGAPTLSEMANYRPQLAPALDFVGIAMALKELGKGLISRAYKSRVERNEELLRELLLRNAAEPTPTPEPAGAASPSPSPTPAS